MQLQIPKSLAPLYCELVGAAPANRPNPADVITKCRKPGGFFKNELVDSLLFLEEIQIKDKAEKTRFFSALTAQLDNFPDTVCRCVHFVLQSLSFLLLTHLLPPFRTGTKYYRNL